MTAPLQSTRLEAVDALRGFALIAIVLLHSVEHYNIFWTPEWEPGWLLTLDNAVAEWMWALLAGKAYATFSLLFGFSFFIQMRNARRRGDDFRLRFAWRMLLLAGFAQFHAAFYNGDILLFYAFCGLLLIPASSLGNRTLLALAFLLLLQPIDWAHIVVSWVNPSHVDLNSRFAEFAVLSEQATKQGNIFHTFIDNLGNGQLYSNFWQVEAGRICQTPALFMLGMWLGRREFFVKTEASIRFWKSIVMIVPVLYIALRLATPLITGLSLHPTWVSHIGIALSMPANFLLMAFYVGFFMLLWFRRGNGFVWQRWPIGFGRMSLTNYIAQSMVGVTIFYGFGLGLWQYTGATISVLIGVCIAVSLTILSRRWLARHRQGPLEFLWKRLTWIGSESTRASAAPGGR